MEEHKKFTQQARTGILGEAFFKAVVCNYCIPHHIVGPTDLGVDFLCEWVAGDKPTGLVFAVQVKAFEVSEATRPRSHGMDQHLCRLEQFTIANSNLTIDDKTIAYWRGLGMPSYLFVVAIEPSSGERPALATCYYKRYTTMLTGAAAGPDKFFYRASDAATFFAFANRNHRSHGFARDLYIDYIRCGYSRGNLIGMSPREIGLDQFPEDPWFGEFLGVYKDQIKATLAKTLKIVRARFGRETVDDWLK